MIINTKLLKNEHYNYHIGDKNNFTLQIIGYISYLYYEKKNWYNFEGIAIRP